MWPMTSLSSMTFLPITRDGPPPCGGESEILRPGLRDKGAGPSTCHVAPVGRGGCAGVPGLLWHAAHPGAFKMHSHDVDTSGRGGRGRGMPWSDAESGVAEGGRFELPRGCPLAVFKTAAIGRSAIPPRAV